MADQATTTSASRSFSDGVKVTWTPSTTTNEVLVQITIGGDTVWFHTFDGDSTAGTDAGGDNYKMSGSLSTEFGGDGTTGQLKAGDDWHWTVGSSSHGYTGFIGAW